MIDFFAYSFGYVLNIIYNIVKNYGVAIIIFTILLKLVMIPLSIKQQRTLKKSAAMQEKLKEIQDKYKNDPQKMNQEMIDLYKQENMSPFGGCFTSIVQIIVILSIFFLVQKPLTFMKRMDNETINNYKIEIEQNLQEGETLRYPEIEIIKQKGTEDEELNINMNFLGLDLSSIPYRDATDLTVFVIPALYVVSSIISMKLTSNNKTKKKEEIKDTKSLTVKEEDPMEEMNKNMMLLTPVMSVSISLVAPLGLALYWLVSNILMIIEKLVINKFLEAKED